MRRKPKNTALVAIWSCIRRECCASVAAALLSGCGGSQLARTLPPAQAPFAQPPASGRTALLYAAGDESSYIFTFPDGKLVAQMTATAYGACIDKQSDVYFAQVGQISEFRHGGTTPVAAFRVNGSAYSCATDPTNGDLASVVLCIRVCGQEVLVLRDHRRHRSRYHVPSLTSLLYCAYDDNGDLFVDGYRGRKAGLAELPKGAHAFVDIALKASIMFPYQIQWDGTHLALETRQYPAVYRLAITGTRARVAGVTHLVGVGTRATQSWIVNGKIAVPSGPHTKRAIEIFIWNYPAGGQPINVLQHFIGPGHAAIDAVTVSR